MPAHEKVLSFHLLDALILLGYLLVLAGIGYHHSRKKQTIKEFFLAGKSVRWIPMGLSLMAALNSGLDYLMQPAGVLKYGILLLVTNLTWLFLYPYVFYVTLPLYRRLDAYSAYEYLERRFNVAVRSLAAVIFLLWRTGWMATALYVPCLAITTATGNEEFIVPTIVALGALVTFYTMMGGIRAVIWTDVTQFCIMFGGLAITLLVILFHVEGGLFAILANAAIVGSPEMRAARLESSGFLNYFFIPLPVFGLLLAGLVSRVTNYTSDQVMVQRFQTTRTIREARQGFVLTAVGDTLWMTVLIFVGVALFTYFNQMGGMPARLTTEEDQIFPYFMGAVFPPGLTGLVIAAIFAASLSSIDSALNSMTSVVTIDFYRRLYLGRKREEGEPSERDQKGQILVSRIVTLAIGMIGIVLACNVSKLGTILEISNKVINGFSGPILGIFFLGMFTRVATSRSVLLGGVAGTLMAVYAIFWSSPDLVAEQGWSRYFPERSISFIWPSVFGLVACLVVGLVSALLLGQHEDEKDRAENWNWFSVTRSELIED